MKQEKIYFFLLLLQFSKSKITVTEYVFINVIYYPF